MPAIGAQGLAEGSLPAADWALISRRIAEAEAEAEAMLTIDSAALQRAASILRKTF